MILKATGVFFVGLGVLGVALPVLPTTPFLLVAAACFAKSSPELHQKLLNNRIFGPLIRDWQEHRAIPKKAKAISLTMMTLAACWSCYILNSTFWQVTVIALILFPAIYVYRLPSR